MCGKEKTVRQKANANESKSTFRPIKFEYEPFSRNQTKINDITLVIIKL